MNDIYVDIFSLKLDLIGPCLYVVSGKGGDDFGDCEREGSG